VAVLLLSTYDLGRQPFGLASPAAWLRQAGHTVATRDLSRDSLDEGEVRDAALIAFYLPMHTATRLALPVITRVRALNPDATVCAYGLYAPLSASRLASLGVTAVLGPEAEAQLVELASGRVAPPDDEPDPVLPRLAFITPDRTSLPPPARYAALAMPDGSRRLVGATEASRGCKHRCRHCPIVPVYNGHFRVVAADVVLADVDQQVAAGARHITFGDPDFLNGPTHARRVVEALHAGHPDVTYDVTIKIEHLLAHAPLLPILASTGCLFVTSAVESVDDEVLQRLEKGHTRADVIRAVALCHDAGLTLVPTFVAFTPWTTLEGYRDLLDTVEGLGLADHVPSVQWGLRLLITQGSRLLELSEVRDLVGDFNPRTLTYPWVHADRRVDRLQDDVMRLVGVTAGRPRREVLARIRETLDEAGGKVPWPPALVRAAIPYLEEPWYC
jgi:radical SAM superfamily enzyme YgiQ (UPF0313 family)